MPSPKKKSKRKAKRKNPSVPKEPKRKLKAKRKRNPKPPSDAKLTVKRLYLREHQSIAAISRMDGCPSDPKTVRTWLKEMHVPLRAPIRVYPREKILHEWKTQLKTLKVDKKALKRSQTIEGVLRSKKAKLRLKLQEKYGCSQKYLSNLIRGEIEP